MGSCSAPEIKAGGALRTAQPGVRTLPWAPPPACYRLCAHPWGRDLSGECDGPSALQSRMLGKLPQIPARPLASSCCLIKKPEPASVKNVREQALGKAGPRQSSQPHSQNRGCPLLPELIPGNPRAQRSRHNLRPALLWLELSTWVLAGQSTDRSGRCGPHFLQETRGSFPPPVPTTCFSRLASGPPGFIRTHGRRSLVWPRGSTEVNIFIQIKKKKIPHPPLSKNKDSFPSYVLGPSQQVLGMFSSWPSWEPSFRHPAAGRRWTSRRSRARAGSRAGGGGGAPPWDGWGRLLRPHLSEASGDILSHKWGRFSFHVGPDPPTSFDQKSHVAQSNGLK